MNKDIEIYNLIDSYLRSELSSTELADFKHRRSIDPGFDLMVVEHENLVGYLKEYGDRVQLTSEMNAIYQEIDVEALKREVQPELPVVRKMWDKYRVSAAIAAIVAMIAVFGTLFSTGYFTEKISNNYLRRKLSSIERSQNAINKKLTDKPSIGPINPGQFGGTGFAITSNGYIVTNYHVVKDADSIYVQNSAGESYKAKQIYIDPTYDLAVLQIIDPAFKDLASLPYTFKKSASSVAESVYTVGFPKDDLVYNEGYVSSSNGYEGDTVAYQVSIPVNPGNSGGPLLDNRGNVVGIINRKQTLVDGVAFAVKSSYLLKSIEAIPQDSLEDKLILNKRNQLSGLKPSEQYDKLKPYIFMVKVY
ncbi:S1C family serine protease [Daejeonella sp.]|uniref:S1C family serine protease n=1 Tax=Daejeonella sp. TaxID=2805397 RepID=UPI003982E938